MLNLFALQGASLWLGLIIVIALFAGLLMPYLYEEIRRGKAEPGPNLPTGAGDTKPGSRGNPDPGQPLRMTQTDHTTLSLRSFHVVLIWLATALAAGTGVWELFNQEVLLGALALGVALLLLLYGGYFIRKAERVHLE